MKCPNCGAEIPDGKVYCEKCGGEILVVADFDDAIVDKTMNSTLSDIAEEAYLEDDGLEYEESPNLLSLIFSGHAGSKFFYALLILVFIGVIIAAVLLGKNMASKNGLEYQLQMAEEEAGNNNLLLAISYLENAYKIDDDINHLFTIADYYYTLGRDNDAIFTLSDIADNEKATNEARQSAYKKLITLYEAAYNYEKLNALIEKCPFSDIKNAYTKYLVEKPVFNYESGTYEEVLDLRVSCGLSSGTIYYTLGNQMPDENSDTFTEPIPLEYGSYTVNAIYINNYGVASEVVTGKYLIDVEFVFSPEILLDSGDYNSAQMIEALIPSMYSLYYTTDGSEPSRNSSKYTEPIPLPLGDSYYRFIEYASDGTPSLVLDREYNLSYDTVINAENAVPYLMAKLMEKGILIDLEGHKPNDLSIHFYVFTTAYNIDGKGDYFFIVEYRKDIYGNTTRTGDIYAMHVIDADKIYKVTTKKGSYSLVNF